MALLETSFLIDILRNDPVALELLDQLERQESVLFVAAPSVFELWEGALQSTISEREKIKVDELLAVVTILPLDLSGAKRAAEVDLELFTKGLPIETEDVMIAGIALRHGEMVVTRDAHYARIPGLKVQKY